MIVTIHQPEHSPWLGFLDKALQSDVFVLLDTVQFRKNYFQNRNRIRTAAGWEWITLPVKQPVTIPINEIRIDVQSRCKAKWLHRVEENYRTAPYFKTYFKTIESILTSAEDRLSVVNTEIIRFLFEALGIKTRLLIASELRLPPEQGGTRVNLSISKHLGASDYLSGISGKDYLKTEEFDAQGIRVRYQEFFHPIYKQLREPFEPGMSALDLLFNHGPASIDILSGTSVPRLSAVFQ